MLLPNNVALFCLLLVLLEHIQTKKKTKNIFPLYNIGADNLNSLINVYMSLL